MILFAVLAIHFTARVFPIAAASWTPMRVPLRSALAARKRDSNGIDVFLLTIEQVEFHRNSPNAAKNTSQSRKAKKRILIILRIIMQLSTVQAAFQLALHDALAA